VSWRGRKPPFIVSNVDVFWRWLVRQGLFFLHDAVRRCDRSFYFIQAELLIPDLMRFDGHR